MNWTDIAPFGFLFDEISEFVRSVKSFLKFIAISSTAMAIAVIIVAAVVH